MREFLVGISSALCLVIGLIFLKFWIQTRDRLCLLFAVAFWILAADWAVIAVLPYFSTRPSEHNVFIYSVRLLAFLLILVAIIDKNRRRFKRPGT